MNLLKFFFCSFYRLGMKYNREKQVSEFKKASTIHYTSIIQKEGRILNNRDKSSIIIGANTIVNGELMTFKHGGKITIGDYCYIGERSKIWSAENIHIGNRVLIAHNVNIHDQNSHPLDSKERHIDQKHIMEIGFRDDNDLNEKPIKIDDDAWIGFNSVILKGVTIGKGAIVGAGSMVTKDVPDYAVVAGSPSKIIKYTT